MYDIAEWLACNMHEIAYNVLYEKGPINDKYTQLRQQHDVEGKPFLFQVCKTLLNHMNTGMIEENGIDAYNFYNIHFQMNHLSK